MKKAVLIYTTVAVCSLAELILLVSYLGPGPPGFSSGPPFGWWFQIFTLPGFAVLFSLLVYGATAWRRRVPLILAIGIGGPPVVLLAFVLIVGALASVIPIGIACLVGLLLAVSLTFAVRVDFRENRAL